MIVLARPRQGGKTTEAVTAANDAIAEGVPVLYVTATQHAAKRLERAQRTYEGDTPPEGTLHRDVHVMSWQVLARYNPVVPRDAVVVVDDAELILGMVLGCPPDLIAVTGEAA